MKRCLGLCLALCLALSGCGYDPYDPDLLGVYRGTVILAEGYEIQMTEIYPGENYIVLREEGEGTLCLAGSANEIQWGFRGERFFLEIQGEKSEGRLDQGTIKLDYLDMGMELRFTFAPDYVPGEMATDLTEEQKFWQGDWYGWWIIDEGTGSFADATGNWWDLCATVTIGSNSLGQMVLWDQDGSKEEPLGEVSFYLDENGAAVSQEGYFGAVVIERGDWYIDPKGSGAENMLVISNGGENDTGTFYYTAYLRPWGETWEDIREKPYHYDSWYLPMIQQGQPMPDKLPE